MQKTPNIEKQDTDRLPHHNNAMTSVLNIFNNYSALVMALL